MLATPLLLELVEWFERSRQELSGINGERLCGVPAWELRRSRHLLPGDISDWFDEVGVAGFYPAPGEDDSCLVELDEDDELGGFRYRCPVTFRKKHLAADEIAVHAVRSPRFLHLLAELLSIPQALRSGIQHPQLDQTLWALGKARIGPFHTDVWVVRNLHENLEAVFEYFGKPAQPEQGIVLTTSAAIPGVILPPRNYRFIPLKEAIVERLGRPLIDTERIHRLMTSVSGTAVKPSLPVEYDEFAGILKISGKEPWEIQGEKQRASVSYMFTEYLKGRTQLKSSEILKAAGYSDRPGRSRRMQNLFAGNKYWLHYIKGDGDGMYGFKLD